VADALLGSVLIVCLAPLFFLTGLVVLVDIGPTLIFWQVRPGAHGRPFKLYKFCTMREAYDRSGRRIPDAQRISAIGRALRRTRIDELPQLFNIVRGEMSFVGPRPLLAADQPHEHSARLGVRPGLTGWAQVNGGREISAADKAAMDLWYILNAGFALDLLIMAATLRMMVLGDRVNVAAVHDAWRELISSGVSLLALPDDGIARSLADVPSERGRRI
jgi:lipopolysaccharide/colanic/teichoic acid biosynthesis glycosyltransferase